MIVVPRRSVTRFFIPLIDVLTLLFCIYLLMPVADNAEGTEVGAGNLAGDERRELEKLRGERRAWRDLDHLRRDREALRHQLDELRREKMDTLQQRLAICVLEITDDGTLTYFDPLRTNGRRVPISADNVKALIRQEQRLAADKEAYFLILYPRPEKGDPVFPLRSQREEYDRWFAGVAHGYEIPAGER